MLITLYISYHSVKITNYQDISMSCKKSSVKLNRFQKCKVFLNKYRANQKILYKYIKMYYIFSMFILGSYYILVGAVK